MVNATNSKLLKEWKVRLGLTDWSIKLYDNCTKDEMSSSGVMGCVDFVEVNRTARIEIIDPACYGNRVVPYDYERILVHELLHLKMCLLFSVEDGYDDRNVIDRMTHQLLDDIAKSLVDAKRFKKGCGSKVKGEDK